MHNILLGSNGRECNGAVAPSTGASLEFKSRLSIFSCSIFRLRVLYLNSFKLDGAFSNFGILSVRFNESKLISNADLIRIHSDI